MKIIVDTINKGGTGKSTISFNLSDFLTVEKNKKVLLMDGDSSCNLSFSFKNLNNSTMYDLFSTGNVEINHITDNLDFIKGSELLTDDELDLKSKQNNCLQLFMWFANNPDIEKTYDYVVIDTHNDKSLVTSNFIAVADIVLGISEPSRNGYRAWLELRDMITYLKSEVIEPISRKSYIDCNEYLIANNVKFFGNNLPNSAKQFFYTVETDDKYLGMIPKKELLEASLANGEGIFTLKKKYPTLAVKHEKFYSNVQNLFEKIERL